MTRIKKIVATGSFFAVLILLSTSCTKEGPGGNSTIRGKITVQTWDKEFRVQQASYPAADEDVFIIYGTGDAVSDRVRTSYDGTFRFRFLNKGDYKLFVYSDDPQGTHPAGVIPFEKTVTLASGHETVDAGEFVIYKGLDVNDGHATITGRVYQIDYAKNFLYIIDTTYAVETPVYLVYENDPTYSRRVRTLDDGTVAFPNLIMGNYKVIAYADDMSDNGAKVPKTRYVTVTSPDGSVDFGNIYIEIKK